MVSITFLVPPCWPACVTGLFIPCHILQIKPHSQHHNFWEWMLRHYQFINDTLETSGLYYKAKRHHRRENKSRVAAAKTVPERYHKKKINWICKVNIHEDNWKGHTHTHTHTQLVVFITDLLLAYHATANKYNKIQWCIKAGYSATLSCPWGKMTVRYLWSCLQSGAPTSHYERGWKMAVISSTSVPTDYVSFLTCVKVYNSESVVIV